ncbi:MAG: PAS domain S-box protein [Rhodospirillaceae bacterium]
MVNFYHKLLARGLWRGTGGLIKRLTRPVPAPGEAGGTEPPSAAPVVRALARANFFAIAAVMLLLLTAGGLALWSSYRGSLHEAQTRAAGTGAILAEQIELSLVGVDNLLQGLADRLATGALSGKALTAWLARRGSDIGMVRNLTVVALDGKVLADSRAERSGPTGNVAAYAFFRAHLNQDDGGLYIGPPVRGPIDGQWIVPVSRAVRSADGVLKAVVAAALDPEYFQKLFHAINVDGRLWGVLTKDDGALLVPFPFNARLIETPIAGYPWFVSHLHESRKAILRIRTPDGIDRLVVHRALGRWPLIVAIGLATDDVLTPFFAEARLWALGLAAAFGLIIIGARYHLHQTRRIAEQAGALASSAGELHYRNLLLDAQLQMSPDGILVVDAGGHIQSWNQRFAEIWRLSPDLLVENDRDLALELALDQLVDPNAFLTRVGQLFRNLAEEDAGGELHFKDGRIVERFSRGLSDTSGRVSGRIWFFRDVTLSRRAAETARKLAAIVNSSGDAIIGKTVGGLIESWNAAAELTFGYTAEQVIGQPLQMLFPPEQVDTIGERLAAAGRGARIAHLETVGRHASGSDIHLSVTISPIRDEDGTVTGLSTIARDIGRRKRAETALREREQRNRVVLEALSEGVLLYDAEGVIVAANSAAHHILGRLLDRPALVAGETLDVLGSLAFGADGTPVTHADQPAEIARTTGSPVLDVVIGLRRPEEPASSTIWLLVNAQPIGNENGEVDGVVVSLLDITTRKRAEEELRESERNFRRTFDESPIGAAMVSLDNRFLRVNAELCRIIGGEPNDLLGLRTSDIALDGYSDTEAELSRQLVDGEVAYYQIDKQCRRKDGTEIWLHFSVRVIRDAAGQPGYFLPMIEDITERKLAEERLARSEAEARAAKTTADLANRAKSEFLATMSHELRSPLNAILGFAEILTLEMFGPLGSPRYLGYAKDIHDSGHLLLSVIGDILDLSKVEAGKLELHEENVNIDATIASAMRLVHTRAHDHGLALISEIAPGLPRLLADGRLITQMVVNLLSNAIKFTPRAGRVTVKATLVYGGVGGLVLSVTDTGIGIAPEDLPKVLAPFEQVDNHLTRTQTGTGLGLPLVKSLIELHGGIFGIESEVQHGTTITLTFPPERLRLGRS